MEHITKNQFNIVIVGTGGQGLITILKIISQAVLIEGKDIKTSELHGLSQRGGSVEVHLRFGKEIFSPLVKQGSADLVIALEMQETLKACYYASKQAKTIFLVNDFFIPIPGKKLLGKSAILKNLEKFSQETILIPASALCKKQTGTPVTAGVFLISLACFKNLIPLSPDSILQAIKKIVPEKYLELNKKTWLLAKTKNL
ncbi:indolepyruvate oxidoreductase subunit beta [Candidatus Parcubacteria bacterium]|nr:indolepyruvate oxidoreductase subunit beta [Candidatus Parcubacteria bacterium]